MNRVTLIGRLAGPPRLAYTPEGVPVATARIAVPRPPGRAGRDPETDEVDLVAYREAALGLKEWGARDVRVSLEGRLRLDTYDDEAGRRLRGIRVHVDLAHPLDPAPEPERPARGFRLLPTLRRER